MGEHRNMAAGVGPRGWRLAGGAAGLALVALAVGRAVSGADLAMVSSAPPAVLAAIAVGVAASLGATTALFGVVTRSFDAVPPVGWRVMWRLVCASALLNYLPLRPGLAGRATYLKLRHGLPLRQSGLILLVVLAVNAVVLGMAAGALVSAYPAGPGGSGLWAGGAALLLLAAPAGWCAGALLRRPVVAAWSWLPLKVLDLLAGSARLWLAMSVVGHGLTWGQAIAATAAGQLVSLLGLTPGGLGLREWAVAAVAAALAPVATPVAMAAALVDRAIEVLVVLPLGLWALVGLRARPTSSARC